MDHEDVLARALRDVAALVEHDRLVEAVELGLRLGESGVGVDAGDLRPGRDAGIGDPSPATRLAAGALLDVQIRAERSDEDQQVVLEVVQADAEDLASSCRRAAGCTRPRGSRTSRRAAW